MHRWICALIGAQCVLAGSAVAQLPWVEVAVPRIGLWPALVHDVARGKNVLVGATWHDGFPHVAWEWNERGWTAAPALQAPGSRAYAVAYDVSRTRTVVVPWPASNSPVETWEWDGIDWRLAARGTGPRLSFSAMAYDLRRARVVTFGSIDPSTNLPDETWEWDGKVWARLTPAAKPPGRIWHTLVFDAARHRTVLFGGGRGSNSLNDLWEFDGHTWVQRFPVVSPPPMSGHAAAFDLRRQRMVVLGGNPPETWEWDGTSWLKRLPTHVPPWSLGAAAYDVRRGTVVMYQPVDPEGVLWEWDGNDWLRIRHSNQPLTSRGVRTASFTPDGSVVRFGGAAGYPSAATWRWRDGAWRHLSPNTTPPARESHGMAFDGARNRIVMFGGRGTNNLLADTWEWDGTDWMLRAPAQSPSPRRAHAMAYDPANRRVILFGGNDANGPSDETWTWDGTNWTRSNASVRPPARYLHAMAHDPARQRSVLFGGVDSVLKVFADTWEFDGTTWVQASPTVSPTQFYEHAMTWDPDRQRVLMFGGAPYCGLWEWDGQDWVQTSTWHTAMLGHGLEYEAKLQRLLVTNDRTFLIGAAVRAGSTEAFGSGCGAVHGFTASAPRLGNDVEFELVASLPVAPCVIALAPGQQSVALGGGCSLYVKDVGLILFAATNAFGVAQTYGIVPLDRALRGLTFYAQGFVADPQGPVLGMSFTAGRKLVIGD